MNLRDGCEVAIPPDEHLFAEGHELGALVQYIASVRGECHRSCRRDSGASDCSNQRAAAGYEHRPSRHTSATGCERPSAEEREAGTRECGAVQRSRLEPESRCQSRGDGRGEVEREPARRHHDDHCTGSPHDALGHGAIKPSACSVHRFVELREFLLVHDTLAIAEHLFQIATAKLESLIELVVVTVQRHVGHETLRLHRDQPQP